MQHAPLGSTEPTATANGPSADSQDARFAEVLRHSYRRLQGIARNYAPVGEDQDLLQEILLQVWRALPGFDGRASIGSWAWRIGLNTAFDALRRRYARPSLHAMPDDELQAIAPASVGQPVDPDALLQSFLRALPPVDRAVLMLSLDDLSYAEIADITGLNVNAVGIRLARIKKRFNQDHVDGYQ
jgi:RNA polymerase sigma-70 factor, ECF subfamily